MSHGIQPSPSTTPRPGGSAFDRLLAAEQLANTHRLNILRFAGGSVFLALEWLPGQVGGQTMQSGPLLLLTAYASVALVLMLLGRRSLQVARVSRLAVPVLDMPLIFFIQHLNLLHTSAPRAVGNFTIAIYIACIMLAALSLSRWQIVLAAVMAVSLQFILHLQAGETLHGMAGGAFLLIGVTTLCAYALRRRTDMVWALCAEQLRSERLGRYFSPTVAAEIEKTGEGVSRAQLSEVTVLFSDLRDFTTLAEEMDTSEIFSLLNEYFEHMVTVVFEHGGTLDKYIGDGLMVYFGAPVVQEDHAARAVRCALAMQQRLVTFNAARQGRVALRMGIGIHTGTALVGSIGALHRREYTAIGDTVNLAARIEQLCKIHQEEILLSLATRDLAASITPFRQVTDCVVKGRTASVQVFAPG